MNRRFHFTPRRLPLVACSASPFFGPKQRRMTSGSWYSRDPQMPEQPNLLDAIRQIVHGRIHRLPSVTESSGNPLPAGNELEAYVKDRLAGIPDGDYRGRAERYEEIFSWQGSANNPPDIMYRGGDAGDAFEVKKIGGGRNSSIHLNSSPPKDRLLVTNPRLKRQCRECEIWSQRDFFYVIGCVEAGSESISWLWFVDARLAMPGPDVFDLEFSKLKKSIGTTPGFNLITDTKEIGRLVDVCNVPGVNLRIRGMWSMPSPWVQFANLPGVRSSDSFCVHALIRKDKWHRYPELSRHQLENISDRGLSIDTVRADDPNSTGTVEAVLIRWEFPD